MKYAGLLFWLGVAILIGGWWSIDKWNGYPGAHTMWSVGIVEDKDDARVQLFVGTEQSIYRTSDEGTTWVEVLSKDDHSPFMVIQQGSSSDYLSAGTLDGRIYTSWDSGHQWQSIKVSDYPITSISEFPPRSENMTGRIIYVATLGDGVYRVNFDSYLGRPSVHHLSPWSDQGGANPVWGDEDVWCLLPNFTSEVAQGSWARGFAAIGMQRTYFLWDRTGQYGKPWPLWTTGLADRWVPVDEKFYGYTSCATNDGGNHLFLRDAARNLFEVKTHMGDSLVDPRRLIAASRLTPTDLKVWGLAATGKEDVLLGVNGEVWFSRNDGERWERVQARWFTGRSGISLSPLSDANAVEVPREPQTPIIRRIPSGPGGPTTPTGSGGNSNGPEGPYSEERDEETTTTVSTWPPPPPLLQNPPRNLPCVDAAGESNDDTPDCIHRYLDDVLNDADISHALYNSLVAEEISPAVEAAAERALEDVVNSMIARLLASVPDKLTAIQRQPDPVLSHQIVAISNAEYQSINDIARNQAVSQISGSYGGGGASRGGGFSSGQHSALQPHLGTAYNQLASAAMNGWSSGW